MIMKKQGGEDKWEERGNGRKVRRRAQDAERQGDSKGSGDSATASVV
jgi:hypothetical protein